jgi:hypothetical protein
MSSRRLWTLGLLFGLASCGTNEPEIRRYAQPTFGGTFTDWDGADVFYDPAICADERARLRGAYTSARQRVADFFGARYAPAPLVVFCGSDPCRVYFTGPMKRSWNLEPGGRAPGGTYVAGKRATIIIVRTDAAAENVLVRELSHVELQFRTKPGHVPAWFNEGVATFVGHEPGCGNATSLASVDLGKLDRNEDWLARTGDPTALIRNSCRARQEVASWLEKRGLPQLVDVLDAVSAGLPFKGAYESPNTPQLPANPFGPDGSLTKEAIHAIVTSNVPRVKACYVNELAKSPTLTGRVVVSWTLEPDGHVSAAKVESTTMNNERLESCLVRQTLSWTFPKAPGTATISYPFVFQTSR